MTLMERYHKVVQCAFENRMTHKLRMSHYISRFAAFFNDVRAKTSISASYKCLLCFSQIGGHEAEAGCIDPW